MYAIDAGLLSFEKNDGELETVRANSIALLTTAPDGGTRIWFPDGDFVDVRTPGDKVRGAWRAVMDRGRRPFYRARVL